MGRVGEVAALVAATLIAAVAVGSCSSDGKGGSADAEPAADVTVVASEMEFTPDEVAVEAGSFTYLFRNEGSVRHDLRIDGVVGSHVEAPPGQWALGRVDLEPGEYTFLCTVAGHRAAGMEGTIVVS